MNISKKNLVVFLGSVLVLAVLGNGRTNNDDSYLMHWFVEAIQSGDLVGALTSGVLLLAVAAFFFRDRIDYTGFGSDGEQ